MAISPSLSKSVKHELHAINPHLEAKWNGRMERWEIWFNDRIKPPYIVVVSKNHFDKRIFDEVRHAFWFSSHIRQNIVDMQNEAEYFKTQREKYHEDNLLEACKEAEPLMRTLADAGNSSYGKSKTMFSGIGESR